VIGSKAAKSASQTQAEAATGVAESAKKTGETAATDIIAAGEKAATDVTATGEQAAVDVTAAGEKAGKGAWLSAEEANALLKEIYGGAVADLEPYKAAGATALETLTKGTAEGGEFNKPFTAADLEFDPGYQFRMEEGQKALERSAAARGTLLGGGTLKALSRYSQGVASDEYSKAFERARISRNDRFSQFTSMSGIGQNAVNASINAGQNYGSAAAGNIVRAGEYEGNANMNAANQAGDFRLGSVGQAGNFRVGTVNNAGNYRMQGEQIAGNATIGAANAQAAGTIGSANAWSSALSGIGKTAADAAYSLPYYENYKATAASPSTTPSFESAWAWDAATGTYKRKS